MAKYSRFDSRNSKDGRHKKFDQEKVRPKIREAKSNQKVLKEVMHDDENDYDDYEPQQLTE